VLIQVIHENIKTTVY